MSVKLDLEYFQNNDVVFLAQDLLGKIIVHQSKDGITAARVTETEAYRHYGDKACHAHLNKKTKRNSVMHEEGGKAYVYLCYGIHHLFNIVTNKAGFADAVLIRAAEPIEGVNLMLRRRGLKKLDQRLSSGPGNFSKAMGFDRQYNRAWLDSDKLFIRNDNYTDLSIVSTTRIGIDYAEEDALLPWRFYLSNSKFVSKR
jgi:DNA-3-methyladenine glycosylase